MRNKHVLFAIVVLAGAPSVARASGDVGVVFVFIGQALMVVAFIATMPAFRTWRERSFVSFIFFAALGGVSLLTANVPYSANSHWLVPTLFCVPLAAWGLATLAVRAFRPRAA